MKQDLYRKLILEHAREPRNFRRIDDATHTAEGINPLCGDKLRLYLQVNEEIIKDIGFEGSGCAIAMASASLLTETVNSLPVGDADACFEAITQRLGPNGGDTTLPESVDFSELAALDGVRQHPSRVKCATLPWHALHAALHHPQSIATTE